MRVLTGRLRYLSSGASGQPRQQNVLRRVWRGYTSALEHHPLPVKVTSAAAIFAAGDILAQRMEREGETPHNASRTGRMVAFGCCATVFVHGWWNVLEPLAARVYCPTSQRLRNTVFKVLCDQSFGAGSFNLMFFAQTSLMEGQGVGGAVQRVRDHLWPQMQRHWCFWPWFHLCNFYYNPLHQRVFFQNVALIGWSTLLSSVSAAASDKLLEAPSRLIRTVTGAVVAGAVPARLIRTVTGPSAESGVVLVEERLSLGRTRSDDAMAQGATDSGATVTK
jgi:protein Mpv17